ncbi:MAG: prephenate dehydrogenase/arogenate dehydrogenase family protein [Methylococcales bacterium]|jgi:prephenate dehydrogenase|nr:prephenate dehydrogenase/arogenate dehydrogenase family protein [Methylococcales bacterium]
MIRRLALIGVGLIGGSLVRALREKNLCNDVVGCGRSADNLKKAVELGVIDRYEHSAAKAVEGADMVVVAVPLGAMQSVFSDIVPHLADDAVVTDVGSSKAGVIADLLAVTKTCPAWFVPGHPIAGTEKSGVEASFSTLFQQRRVILTPTEQSSEVAVEKVRAMWTQVGANVVSMGVERHDRVLAATSHLPHMLAFAFVNQLAGMPAADDVFKFAAGGFRDFSRIASSDPTMWRDIFIGNKTAVLDGIKGFQKEMQLFSRAIENEDAEFIIEYIQNSKKTRDDFVELIQSS